MSWSVSGIGKPVALANKLTEDFNKIHTMDEPEETGRRAAKMIVEAMIPIFPPSYLVKVECNGSQITPDFSKAPNEKVNSLCIKIQSLGPLVE